MLVAPYLRRLIRHGCLTVISPDGSRETFGRAPGPEVTVTLKHPGVAWRIMLNPSLGAGEAYMDGRLTVEDGSDIYDLMSLVATNFEDQRRPWNFRVHDRLGWLTRRIWQYNPARRSRRNVVHHYDLSDELYKLFLDTNRQYSCAYFRTPDASLEQAQIDKMRHIASKLLLKPGHSVLDIGCGWGGLALHLARSAHASVHGLTLSEQQLKVARERAAGAGLSDRVSFELKDYRHNEAHYDRIVSVGMFEHVGVGHYGEFFRKLGSQLKPDGIALLHTIGRSRGPGSTDPFIRKYIFPGGYIPALSEVVRPIERAGLIIADIEVLRLHYADTLRAWRRRFKANWNQAKSLYDERFCRMWEFYLAGAEISFRHFDMVVFQIQLAAQGADVVPIVRDYVTDSDRLAMGAALAAE